MGHCRLLIVSPVVKHWGLPKQQGLCSQSANLWATSDFVPRCGAVRTHGSSYVANPPICGLFLIFSLARGRRTPTLRRGPSSWGDGLPRFGVAPFIGANGPPLRCGRNNSRRSQRGNTNGAHAGLGVGSLGPNGEILIGQGGLGAGSLVQATVKYIPSYFGLMIWCNIACGGSRLLRDIHRPRQLPQSLCGCGNCWGVRGLFSCKTKFWVQVSRRTTRPRVTRCMKATSLAAAWRMGLARLA